MGVYEKLHLLYESVDAEKCRSIGLKIGTLLKKQGNLLQASLQLLSNAGNGEDRLSILEDAVLTLNQLKQLDEKTEDKLEDTLVELCGSESGDRMKHRHLCELYSDRLMRRCKSAEVASYQSLKPIIARLRHHCVNVLQHYVDCVYCMKVLCELEMNENICVSSLPDSVESLYHQLYELSPNSCTSLASKGHEALLSRQLLQAKDFLVKAASSGSVIIEGFLLLSWCYLLLHDYSSALKVANKGIKLCSCSLFYKTVLQELHKCALKCYLKKGCSAPARRLLDEGLNEQLDGAIVTVFQAKCCLLDGEMDKAQQMCEEHLSTDESCHEMWACLGEVQFECGHFQAAVTSLTKAVNICVDCGDYHLLLGKVLWKMGGEATRDRSNCFAHFLKAAKLDPFSSESFMYLGHYYQTVLQDYSKCRRCYQKAIDLNPSLSEAGVAFSDVCLAMGDDSAAFALYQQVTTNASMEDAKWAWLRLGLSQLDRGEIGEAISSFRTVVKADPEDRQGWECLGDAYLQRGGYIAALKAFTRAAQLDETSVYCVYRIAAIKQAVGLLNNAVDEYEIILKQNSNYVPALKGAAESLLTEARNLLKKGFSGRAVDCVSNSLQYLGRAVAVQPGFVCLWKLIGDCCMSLQSVAAERISIVLPKVLRSDNSCEKATSIKEEILNLSTRAYGQALRLAPTSPSIWHDLAISFIALSKCTSDSGREDFVMKAIESLKKAVSLSSNNYYYWNALGVVCCLSGVCDTALAQHCFVRSLQLNSANATTWSNLGTLYLTKGRKDLAHEAFKNAQSASPESVYAWIGQALIAESLGDDEAPDLFRHSTELAIHSEGMKGFAYWVCSNISGEMWKDELGYGFMQFDDNTNRLVLKASDCLAKYTDFIRDDPCIYTLYGLLLELQGLWYEAEQAHCRALNLITQSGDMHNVSIVRNNYARVLSCLGRHVESVALFMASSQLTDFHDLCLLGLALYKSNRLTDSYQVYEQCIEVSPTAAHKSCVYASLGMVAYALMQPTKSKAFFFKSSQTVPPSPHGIMALCALGLVTSDATLAFAAVTELLKLEDSANDALICDIVSMYTQVYLFEGQITKAKMYLVRAIHKYPAKADLWKQLAEFLIQYKPEYSQVASTCAQASWKLSCQVSVTVPMLMAAGAVACGNRLTSLLSWDIAAFRAAQKAVHAVPFNVQSWAIAAASSLSSCLASQSVSSIKYGSQSVRLAQMLLAKVELDCKELEKSVACDIPARIKSQYEKLQLLQCWASEQQIASFLFTGHIQQAASFSHQAMQALSQHQVVESLRMWLFYARVLSSAEIGSNLSDSLQQFCNVVAKSKTSLMWPWKALAHLYLCLGKPVAATLCLQQCKQLARGNWDHSEAMLSFVSWLSTVLCLANPNDEECGWASVANETSLKLLKLCQRIMSSSDLAQLIQSILHMHGKNARAARRHLEQLMLKQKHVSPFILPCVQFQLGRLEAKK
ncbi:tetratricopeptide repeat protein 37-like isoform X2 [Corticium candelabrum]|uniref:tetratricopeptide repeat protein 37-like isoform X2 n=1 Tax=Corticium candelabrum TaxID=121492 RepID=UPI002E26CA36|nr:tetratricopeptide repeat protein 37-like isoform X2 [Corticium candelabrum]